VAAGGNELFHIGTLARSAGNVGGSVCRPDYPFEGGVAVAAFKFIERHAVLLFLLKLTVMHLYCPGVGRT
jgi:hypothetical protein